jgi:hypothetical protein
MSDSFIFPSQATQVFYSSIPNKPGWKVVLRKEVRAQRQVADNSNVFITTSCEATGLCAPEQVPPPPSIAFLVGAIELSAEDQLLASAAY